MNEISVSKQKVSRWEMTIFPWSHDAISEDCIFHMKHETSVTHMIEKLQKFFICKFMGLEKIKYSRNWNEMWKYTITLKFSVLQFDDKHRLIYQLLQTMLILLRIFLTRHFHDVGLSELMEAVAMKPHYNFSDTVYIFKLLNWYWYTRGL